MARLGGGHSDVLAVGGVALAGDALDGALMRDHVSPHFGSRVSYRMPFGENVLTFPKPLLERMCSPAELSLLDRRDVLEFLRTVKSFALSEDDKERMERLLCLVEDRLGFSLFEAIDAVKRELSREPTGNFAFSYPGIEFTQPVSRPDFERSAQNPVERIAERFSETLQAAGVEAAQLDRVYFTGGTAQVPALVTALRARVGARTQVSHVRTFHAVIQGLAQRAQSLVQSSAL
ncbi:MAG: Hsp70 family protein [Polyangiaceae bacterium]